MNRLEKIIGYSFDNQNFLSQALTHRSAASSNNERLEFLGDAILDAIISEKLYNLFPELNEGQLSIYRSSLVNGKSLTQLAKIIELDKFILRGKGQEEINDNILEDAFEALIGAIYLDSKSLDAVKIFIDSVFGDIKNTLNEISDSAQGGKNYKNILQEFLQSRQLQLPVYKVKVFENQEKIKRVKSELTLLDFNKKFSVYGVNKKQTTALVAREAYEFLIATDN